MSARDLSTLLLLAQSHGDHQLEQISLVNINPTKYNPCILQATAEVTVIFPSSTQQPPSHDNSVDNDMVVKAKYPPPPPS